MAEAITEMVLPSTYIEVRAEGLIGVSGIVTGNVGVVGTASRGPVGEPVVLSSFTDARQVFGDYDAWVDGKSGELTLVRALQQVFGNGGSTVYAVRTAATGFAAASRALNKGNDAVVTITALTPGTWAHEVKVQVKPASANAFVQRNQQTVGATPLKPLHARIAPSPRNVVRVTRTATGQTFRYPLTVGGTAAAGKPTVKAADGELAFHASDAPAEGDVVVAAYEVEQASSRDVVIAYRNVRETYTVADADDLAADIAASSTLVSATVAAAQGPNLPDVMADAVPLTGGSDGESAGKSEYATSLALLDEEAINLVVLAGQSCSDASATLLAHVETAENHGHDRIAIVGADGDATATALGNADTVADDRLILVAPGIIADDLAAEADARLTPAYSAAAIAGLIAGLAPQASPTNKTLAVAGLTTLYNDGQLKQLVGGRILALQRRSGFRVVKGITTDDGAFRQISVRRIVDYAKAGTRAGAMPYIGRLNNARVRGALQATLNGFLADMVLNEQLTEFTLTVTATREQEIAGIALVTMLLKPTFSIDYVKVIMNLA